MRTRLTELTAAGNAAREKYGDPFMKPLANRLWWLPLALATMATQLVSCPIAVADDTPQWIWSPDHAMREVPEASCYFRKAFTVPRVQSAEIAISADDDYELYFNGRRIGTGQGAETLQKYDLSKLLRGGRNLVAIEVTNTEGSTGALAARLTVTDDSDHKHTFSTDDSWLTHTKPLPFWFAVIYNDARWDTAQSFGELGKTPPWDDPLPRREMPEIARENEAGNSTNVTDSIRRVETPEVPEFRVEEVLSGEQTGSLTALSFNEFGHAIAAREDGQLLLIHDSDGDQVLDEVRVYCKKLTQCQGLLCLNGQIFATGQGPDGSGLYRLSDVDRNGDLEDVQRILAFAGDGGEYGPHGVVLGPDGFLYVAVGSQARPIPPFAASSPFTSLYEGDLVQPRRQLPEGSPGDAPAPGGTVIRMDLAGDKLEIVAGGLANPYDLAFDREGELFTFDGDTESDLGTPWYRPTTLCHVIPGADFGWRGGWAKWPEYYIDRSPPVLEAGRGAPTGMVFYNHYRFPEAYHNALFVGDWRSGTITAVTLKENGSSYSANTELFMEEPDLRVTDLAVGPDGALYFVTGGRGNPGGLYRIRWTGSPPAGADNLGEGLNSVVRQPQIEAAWSRQKIAATRVEMNADWHRLIPGVALSSVNPWFYRTRALDLMQLYSPTPTTEVLVQLSEASSEKVRAKAAYLMGIHANAETRTALTALLQDSDRRVRRIACQSLLRAGQTVDVEELVDLLGSDDAGEAMAARHLLQRLPSREWARLLESKDHRLIIQTSVALMTAHPNKSNAQRVLHRLQTLMSEFITDQDFIDMLRVMQLAMIRGDVRPGEIPALTQMLAEEFPSGDATMNRELVRLLTYLRVGHIAERYVAQLNADNVAEVEKLHLALYLAQLPQDWTAAERIALLDVLERAQQLHEADESAAYYAAATQELLDGLDSKALFALLAEGAAYPLPAFRVLYGLPETLDESALQILTRLDQQILPRTSDAHMRLKIGVVAVLARSGDPASMRYLRQLWDRDPERRPALAMGLAQSNEPENWPLLLQSLQIIDGDAAREVLAKLQGFDQVPDLPEHYRQVILKAEQLGAEGGVQALELLTRWTGKSLAEQSDWPERLAAWKTWYTETFPEALPADLPVSTAASRWSYDELVHQLTGVHAPSGSVEVGAEVFREAGCVQCHRRGENGGQIGPDLSSTAKRLMKKEIVLAMLHPSHRIASNYRTEAVFTEQGQIHTGKLLPGKESNVTLLRNDGVQVAIPEEDVTTIRTVKVSDMPDGLLEDLSVQQLADLLAYLHSDPTPLIAQEPDEDSSR
jgi:putative heme-binding domain-containing protein